MVTAVEVFSMGVTFELPAQIEQGLRAQLGDLDQAAKEAALVELYRQDRLSHSELAQALGCSRYEADGVLKRHHVTEDLPTADEIEGELTALRALLDEKPG